MEDEKKTKTGQNPATESRWSVGLRTDSTTMQHSIALDLSVRTNVRQLLHVNALVQIVFQSRLAFCVERLLIAVRGTNGLKGDIQKERRRETRGREKETETIKPRSRKRKRRTKGNLIITEKEMGVE